MEFIKKIKSTIASLILLIPNVSLAAIIDKNLKNQLDKGTLDSSKGLDAVGVLISNVRTFISGIAAATAVLFIIIGGIMYITSAGNEEKMKKGKSFLTYAIIGLAMIILAEVILRLFVTKILGGTYQ